MTNKKDGNEALNSSGSRKKRSDLKPEFMITASFRSKPKKLSQVQQIQLDIIEHTNFNLFNGKKIVKLLKENHKMWRSVLMPLDLISLRDMAYGHWHADTMYIYPEDSYQFQLEELVREHFQADEIEWIHGSEAVDALGMTEVENKSHVILSVWWD